MTELPATKRRLRFSLRTLLVVTTLVAVGIAWPLYRVNRRRAERVWIEQRGGSVDVFTRPVPIQIAPFLEFQSYQRAHGPEVEPEIPQWRRWFGDEAYNQINLPEGTSQSDVERARALFPEARVEVMARPSSGSGFF